MKNKDKYQTAEKREKAFHKLCYLRECGTCDLQNNEKSMSKCAFLWLEREADEPKRREYTWEEAKALVGKTTHLLRFTDQEGATHEEVVNGVSNSFTSGSTKGTITINSYSLEDLFKYNATIDGEPFGVPVKEEEE